MTNFNLCLLLASRGLKFGLWVLLVYSKMMKIRVKWKLCGFKNITAFWFRHQNRIYNFVLSYIHWPSASREVSEAKCLLSSVPDHHHCWTPADRTHHPQALMDMGGQTKLGILKKIQEENYGLHCHGRYMLHVQIPLEAVILGHK